MSGDKKNLFPSLFILGFSIFIAFSALKLGLGRINSPGPGFIPFIAAVFLLVLSLFLFFNSFKKKVISCVASKSATRYGKTIFIVGTLIGYSFVIDILGFLLATLLLMFVLFHLESRRITIFALVGAFVTTISVYILFGLILGVRFPKGILGF